MIYENKVDDFFIVSNTQEAFTYPLHVHDYIEIIRVLDGSMQMQIGPHVYSLSKGDYSIIFPNIVHDYRAAADGSPSNLNISNCVLSLIPRYKPVLEANYPQSPVVKADQIPEVVNTLSDELHRLTAEGLNPDPNLIGSLFATILGYCLPYLKLTPLDADMNRELSVRIISYVAQHSLENLTQDTIAKKFGISKFALSRIFSGMLKTNFRDYINSQRINYAEYLLLNTDHEITDVCFSSGFQSQQTFNRAFRQHAGMSPSEYRKRHTGLLYPENQEPLLPHPPASASPASSADPPESDRSTELSGGYFW